MATTPTGGTGEGFYSIVSKVSLEGTGLSWNTITCILLSLCQRLLKANVDLKLLLINIKGPYEIAPVDNINWRGRLCFVHNDPALPKPVYRHVEFIMISGNRIRLKYSISHTSEYTTRRPLHFVFSLDDKEWLSHHLFHFMTEGIEWFTPEPVLSR